MFGGRVAQHVPQFTVTAEAELAGEPNHRRLADVGDVGHLTDGQVGRLLDMIPNILGYGAPAGRSDGYTWSMRSRIPTEDCTAALLVVRIFHSCFEVTGCIPANSRLGLTAT